MDNTNDIPTLEEAKKTLDHTFCISYIDEDKETKKIKLPPSTEISIEQQAFNQKIKIRIRDNKLHGIQKFSPFFTLEGILQLIELQVVFDNTANTDKSKINLTNQPSKIEHIQILEIPDGFDFTEMIKAIPEISKNVQANAALAYKAALQISFNKEGKIKNIFIKKNNKMKKIF